MFTKTKPRLDAIFCGWIMGSVAFLLMQSAVVLGQQQQPRAQALAQGGRFAVQLGATSDLAEAEAKLRKAQAQKLDAYLVKSNQPGIGTLYRVRVGNYASRAAAERAAQQFKARGALSEYIIVAYERPLASAAPAPGTRGKVATAPGTQTGAPTRQQNVKLTPSSFSAKGLTNEKVLTNLYLGNFVDIDFDRDDLNFSTLYDAYLNSYARQCRAYLPRNKVEMTRQECTTESVTRNGYGVEISRVCVNWVTVGTGLYADPTMYEAKLKLDRLQAGDSLRTAFSVLTKKDPIAGAMNIVENAQAAIRDMSALVQMNACTSPGLKRFQENLRLFALNKQPIRLDGKTAEASAVTPRPGTPFRDQNYTKLVEDLVGEQSKTWVMNRFLRGSVSGVSVSSRDDKGRPSKIVARYIYNGFSGRSQGSVTLTFTEGLPECMYFFDFPSTCRTPNRKIVAAYASGGYEK